MPRLAQVKQNAWKGTPACCVQSVFLVSMLMICGCSVQSKYIDTRNDLDKSLYYYEQDTREEGKRAISEETEMSQEPAIRRPTRVPHPALVDIDSTIYIQVDKNNLSSGIDEGILESHSQELLDRKERISTALLSLEKVVVSRKKAIDAYVNADSAEFLKLRRILGSVEENFINQLTELWPEENQDTAEIYIEMSDAFDPPKFVKLQKFLNARIDKIEDENRGITNKLESRMASLSIEAFLEHGNGRDLVAIHLDGYDSLEAGRLQRRDRLGLDLSKEEHVRLNEQVSATLKLVDAAERVRREEISLQDALRETIPVVSSRLHQLILDVERLESRLSGGALTERLDKTVELFNEFTDEVRRQAEELAEGIKGDLETMPQKYRDYLKKESGPYVEALTLYVGLKDLENRWNIATELDPELIMDSVGLAGELKDSLDNLRELDAADIEGNLTRFFNAEFSDIVGDSTATLINIAHSEAATNMRAHIVEFYGDIERARDILEKGSKTLKVLSGLKDREIELGTHVPESFKVPLGDVKDTFIELDHTPRLPGNTVTVRATLYDAEDPNVRMMETTASFQVERFGWFAELSPAVVLVKADKLKGGDNGFRFAPTLSWMHHYMPRPDDSSWYSSLLRGFQPAVGMHSAFLNFNQGGSGETIQIGLGTTLSFWENRLQFGAGYNLMAASDDEGKFYYFVGTDLIGLLQSVGIGK